MDTGHVFGRMISKFISGKYFVAMWIVSFFLLILSKNKSFYWKWWILMFNNNMDCLEYEQGMEKW